MEIINTQVYGLSESIIRSGFPMKIDIRDIDYTKQQSVAMKLANCPSGTGHDSFLKGIIVQADITAPTYWWPQWMRYHFQDTISSQSKMHTLAKLTLDELLDRVRSSELSEDEYFVVAPYLMKCFRLFRDNKITLEQYLGLIPMGFEYTAGVTTNYLQLKSIYKQRQNHTLVMWSKTFVDWINILPHKEFILKEDEQTNV